GGVGGAVCGMRAAKALRPCPAAWPIIRSTSDSGRKRRRQTPRVATLASVENAITGTLRPRATCPTGVTVSANKGPRIISAPSSTACCAAFCADCALPASSLASSWMSGLLNSARAISAALRMDWAAIAALPAPESGRTSAALTCPVPMLVDGWEGAPDGELGRRSPREKLPEQPASRMEIRGAKRRGRYTRPTQEGRQACNTRNIRAGLRDGGTRCQGWYAAAMRDFMVNW